MAYTITKRSTQKGVAFDLYYRRQGVRYRPLLGYNLSSDEAERLAIEMIGKIHQGKQALSPSANVSPTLQEFLPTYWQTLKIQKRIDLRRPEIILETHLLPRFGSRPLDALSAQDGLAYISARLEAGAAAGTIRKEWGVLMRILNLAVDFEKIDRNRFKRVQLPEANITNASGYSR